MPAPIMKLICNKCGYKSYGSFVGDFEGLKHVIERKCSCGGDIKLTPVEISSSKQV